MGGFDETVSSGGVGIAKDIGMVGWINSIQAAWHHRPAMVVSLRRQSRGSSAEDESRRNSNLGLGQHVRISSSLIVTHTMEIGGSAADTIKLPFRELNSI
jgi:hypothetical protein